MIRKGKSEKGFTLVEIIVVITIITILVSMLVVMIVYMIDRARYAKTASTVKMLDAACKSYRLDYGVFPPNDKGDSRCLHYYLGTERMLVTQHSTVGGDIQSRKPPVVEFTPDILKDGGGTSPNAKNNPVPIVDAFDNLLRYASPGTFNSRGVDIWSPGKDGVDQKNPTAPDFDDVTNWGKEF